MPYYIYKVTHNPILQLKKLEQHDEFRPASARAKELRRELALTESCTVKVIFAEHELGAEDLLSQVREAIPEPGDDY
jgi:hypothetical protein